MKVSVIIPFYNKVDLLCIAVDSALQQTYQNFEIIVVNDGSAEDVSEFIKKYQDKIKYYYKNNSGPAATRNYAINMATGDYFAFLDSDDVWLPEKLEKQIQFMEKTGAVWSHTGFYYWFPENNKLKEIDVSSNYGDVFLMSIVSLKMATPTVIVSRRAHLEHPELCFPENMRYGQDSKYFENLSLYYPVALITEPLAKIRMRSDNTNKRAIIRIKLKAEKYKEIKLDEDGRYKSIPRIILLIYFLYMVGEKIFAYIQKNNKVMASNETFAKILWCLPYILERVVYLKLVRNRKKYLNFKN